MQILYLQISEQIKKKILEERMARASSSRTPTEMLSKQKEATAQTHARFAQLTPPRILQKSNLDEKEKERQRDIEGTPRLVIDESREPTPNPQQASFDVDEPQQPMETPEQVAEPEKLPEQLPEQLPEPVVDEVQEIKQEPEDPEVIVVDVDVVCNLDFIAGYS